MPVKRRAAKLRAEGVPTAAWELMNDLPLSEPRGVFAYLMESFGMGDVGLQIPTLEEHWRAHRQAILAEWVEERPGTRPRCWWAWDAPSGEPGSWLVRTPAVPSPTEQAAYLSKHKLFQPGERERVKRAPTKATA